MSIRKTMEDESWVTNLTSEWLCHKLRESGKPTLQKIADIFEEEELDGEDMTTIIYEELVEILPKLGMRKKLEKFMAQLGVTLPRRSDTIEEGNAYFEEIPQNEVSEQMAFSSTERPYKKRKLLTTPRVIYPPNNTRKLYIRNIPNHKNNISYINAFFSKWGNISNLELIPDQHKALLQYSTVAEANRCFDVCQERIVMGDHRIKVEYWKASHIADAKRDEFVSEKGNESQATVKASSARTPSKLLVSDHKIRVSTDEIGDNREELYILAEKHNITMVAADRILRTAEILRRSVCLQGLPRCRSKIGLRALSSDLEGLLSKQCNLRPKHFEVQVSQEKSTGRILLSSEKAGSIYKVVKALDGSKLEPDFIVSATRDSNLVRFLDRPIERDFFKKVRPILEKNFYPTLSDTPPKSPRLNVTKLKKPSRRAGKGLSDWGLAKGSDKSAGSGKASIKNEPLSIGNHVRISGGEFDGKVGVVVDEARKNSWLVNIKGVGQLTLREKRLKIVNENDRCSSPSVSSNSDSNLPDTSAYNSNEAEWRTFLKEKPKQSPLQKMYNPPPPLPNQFNGLVGELPIVTRIGKSQTFPFTRGRGNQFRARGRGVEGGRFPTFARGRGFPHQSPARGFLHQAFTLGRGLPQPVLNRGRGFTQKAFARGRGLFQRALNQRRGLTNRAFARGRLHPQTSYPRARVLPPPPVFDRGRGRQPPFFYNRGRGVSRFPQRGRRVVRGF